jgi:hypothetical protein
LAGGQAETKVCQECKATDLPRLRNGADGARICDACYMIYQRVVKKAYNSILKQGNDMLKTGEKFSIAAAKKALEDRKQWEAVMVSGHGGIVS